MQCSIIYVVLSESICLPPPLDSKGGFNHSPNAFGLSKIMQLNKFTWSVITNRVSFRFESNVLSWAVLRLHQNCICIGLEFGLKETNCHIKYNYFVYFPIVLLLSIEFRAPTKCSAKTNLIFGQLELNKWTHRWMHVPLNVEKSALPKMHVSNKFLSI